MEKHKGMKELGNYIAEKRRRRMLSLRELEAITGLNNTFISQLETGVKTYLPKPAALAALARALGVTMTDLLAKAGYADPTIEPETIERQIDRRFAHVLTDPRFKHGMAVKGEYDFNLKRFVVELYEAT